MSSCGSKTRHASREVVSSVAQNAPPPPTPLLPRTRPSYGGRPDEVQIVVANSELAIERGDFDKALRILGDVPPDSPAYVRVQVQPHRTWQQVVGLSNVDVFWN